MSTELEHHGIIGMKWGVRRTPEQLGHASKKSVSKGKNAVDLLKEKLAKKKLKAKQVSEAKRRQKILSDPGLLKDHYKEFSEDEVRNAIKNFRTEKEISDLSKDRIRQAENFLGSMAKITTSAIVVYNNATKAYNTFFPTEKPLPQIKNPDKVKEKKD